MDMAAMALHDMKMTKKEAKDLYGPQPEAVTSGKSVGPKYPYGLEVRLEKESMKKLGISVEGLKAGQMVDVVAKAKVVSIRTSDSADGGKDNSVELLLTKMAVTAPKKKI